MKRTIVTAIAALALAALTSGCVDNDGCETDGSLGAPAMSLVDGRAGGGTSGSSGGGGRGTTGGMSKGGTSKGGKGTSGGTGGSSGTRDTPKGGSGKTLDSDRFDTCDD